MQNLQAFHVLSTSTFKLRDEMGDKNVQKFPDLPQEIIDIIVRDIASQDLTREALKACSLVSKSFCSSCRRHLFSDLELVSDKWQSQAARLMEILQNPDNVGLVACVRSLTLVDVPSRRTYSFLGSSTLGRHLYETKLAALTLAARLRLREDNLIKALDLLVQAPNLESFTLHVRRGISFWQREASTRTMKKAVLMACTAPLTTVRLSNFFGIEGSLIARVIHCRTLKELALTNIALRYCDDDANLDLQPITSQIERLDLRRVSYLHVFRTMGRPNLPPFPMSYPFVAFPHLRHLIISGPWLDAEVDALWHFMLGIADTLETLEMHEIKWQDPIQFGKLSSLRNLKILSSAIVDRSFDLELQITCRLLSTAVDVSPVKLQALTIQFRVQMASGTGFRHARSMPGWRELDNILTGGSYPNLCQVDLNFDLFYIDAPSTTAQIDIDTNDILSRLSTRPSIDLQLNIRNICTPSSMAAYDFDFL